MALPSFHSPSFLFENYSFVGSELQLNTSGGIYGNGGTPNDNSHSFLSFPFNIFSSKMVSNITRSGAIGDNDTGYFNNYFEFAYCQGNDFINPNDYIRLHIEVYKQYAFPVSVNYPLKVTVSVVAGQLGIVYTYPTYNIISQGIIPEAGIIIIVNENEGGGAADCIVEWNDIVNNHYFSHTINNYPFGENTKNYWKNHIRLNVEANNNYVAIVDYQKLTVQSSFVVAGIPSGEDFGNLEVSLPLAQNIIVTEILSNENIPVPLVSTMLHEIIVSCGISTGENFGIPRLTNSTKIYSTLSIKNQILEGDIFIDFSQYSGFGDMVLEDRDVKRDNGLETSILISLFSDRLALRDDVLQNDNINRAGWWGDEVPMKYNRNDDYIGSRLWLIERSKTTNETIENAKLYIKESLQWIIDDKVAENIYIDVWKVENVKDTIGISINILKNKNENVSYKYYYNWENQKARLV